MLHAAAMLAGFFIIAFLLVQGWTSHDQLGFALIASLASVGVALRLWGFRKTPFSAPHHFIALAVSRLGAMWSGTMAVIRTAVAADVTVKPALVRVRGGEADAFASAACANSISMAPGAVVVETDGEGMLVHVIDEDKQSADAFAALERRAAALLGGPR